MLSHEQLVAFCESYKKHPDQGVKACRKVLQKNPNSLMHQIALAHFISHLGRHQEALQQCEQVSLKSSEWCEPDIVIEFQHLLVRCSKAVGRPVSSAGKLLIPLWKDQFDKFARLNGREVRSAMFSASFENDQWDLLQQFFAWLQRDFPKQPKYHFSWIAATQILADSLKSIDDKMAQFSSLLAYKSCKMLLTNTLEGKDTPRKISSTQEFRLISNTLRKQGHTDELLELLDNDKVGIQSDIGKNDIEFIRSKLELLIEKQRWNDVYSLCFSSLESFIMTKQNPDSTDQQLSATSWADDWTIWQRLIAAASGLGKQDDVSTMLDKYLQTDPRSRTAGRAKLLLRNKIKPDLLLEQCYIFLDQQIERKACFDDLKDFVEQLSPQDQEALLEKIKHNLEPESPLTSKASARTINALKLTYLVRSTLDSTTTSPSPDDLTQVARTSLDLYARILKDGIQEGDDSCLLAGMILARIALTAPASQSNQSASSQLHHTCLLQSLQIFQHLERNSPHSSEARLCILRVQELLGLYTGSVKTFIGGLNPKQVQWDSLGHLLYTRISTSHPMAVTDKALVRRLPARGADPVTSIENAMKWNGDAIDSVTGLLSRDPEKLAYDKLAEFAEFKGRIDRSFPFAMLNLEKRRIMRMQGKSFGVNENPSKLSEAANDNRDFTSFVNYEGSSHTFEQLTANGSRPGLYWLAQWTLNDLTQTLVSAKTPEAYIRSIEEFTAYLTEHGEARSKELTIAEQNIDEGWKLLNTLACSLTLGVDSSSSSRNIKADLQALAKWTKDNLSRRVLPDVGEDILTWTYLHERWLSLEYIRALDKFCDLALMTAKQKTHPLAPQIPVASINEIKAQGRKVAKEIQSGAQAFSKVLKAGAAKYEDLIKGGDLGEQIVKMVGQNEIRASVSAIIEDAVDGVDGLAKVKLF